MTTNKEWIENLEASLEGLRNNFNKMELGVSNRLQQLEAIINKLATAWAIRQDMIPNSTDDRNGNSSNGGSRITKEGTEGGRPMFF